MVKHTHPGEEIIYILEGSLEYQIEPLQGAGCRRRGRPDLEP